MGNYSLSKLVIKPTLACNCNCPTCVHRRDLHKSFKNAKKMEFGDWKNFFDEVNDLGVKKLDISGGEPTLYKKLPDLIKMAYDKGWEINLNTNGSRINESFAVTLLDSGLDTIHISLYSPKPEVHDHIKCHPGLWQKATEAVKIFSKLEKKYPHFETGTQTYISRDNYLDFPELIELHHNIGSNKIALAYLEGDFEKKFLLNENEIQYFKQYIVPKALKFCEKLDIAARPVAKSVISNLFSEKKLSHFQWANGSYNPGWNSTSICQRPKDFALILANGDVHPCNIVEYTHEPVMGNLFTQPIMEIWTSQKWNEFRQNLFNMCEFCPILIYNSVPLKNKLLLFGKLRKALKFSTLRIFHS